MGTYAKPADLVEITGHGIRLAHPETSFPEPLLPHHVEHLGYLPVVPDPEPELQPGETLERGPLRVESGEIRRGWAVVSSPIDWPALIAERRWQAETAGTTINGMTIDTGRDSQALITGATVQAMLDPNYALRWKTPAGFVELTAEQIIGVATAARAHVQACFNREAELLEALADDTFTPEMMDQGWP